MNQNIDQFPYIDRSGELAKIREINFRKRSGRGHISGLHQKHLTDLEPAKKDSAQVFRHEHWLA